MGSKSQEISSFNYLDSAHPCCSSSLLRIEVKLEEALNQQTDEQALLNPPKNTPARGLIGDTQEQAVQRTLTESDTTLYEPVTTQADSTPSPSDEDAPEFDTSKPYIPQHKRTDLRQRPVLVIDQDHRALPLSPRASDEYSMTNYKTDRAQKHFLTGGQSAEQTKNSAVAVIAERKKRNVDEAVADAKRQLVTVRQREQSTRPPKVPTQDPERTPDPALRAYFQKSADDELQIRRLNPRDWLRVATWWLLKVLPCGFVQDRLHKLLIM